MSVLLAGILIGIGATVAMDIWAIVLAQFFGQPRPNWAMPGRWLGHVFMGKVWHDDISNADPVEGELRLGWAFHYAVGILYGVIWALIAGPAWLDSPSFVPVWIFALLTISAGWFLLQPGMGLGWAASKTPNPLKTRAFGLVAHTWFGVGMWATALIIG